MTNEKAVDLLRRMQEPEVYEPPITEEAFEALEMAIRALGTDTNVGDLISRKAVLYALDKRFDSIPMEQTQEILLLRKDLREMPPITPIQELLEVSANRDYWQAQCRAYKTEIERIRPKITLCKDCDWWTKQKDSLQGRCELTGSYPTSEWYCGNARKRKATT